MTAPALLVAVTLAYIGIAIDFAMKGNGQMGVVFLGYSIANLGFIWEAWK